MSILDRYVIRQVLTPFVLGLLVFTFIFIIPELMKVAEPLIAKGVSATVIAWLAVQLIPYGLSLTIPMSLLLALLVGFGRLSADREFVAMQACGISLLRLLRPVGLIAVGGWAVTSYVLIVAVPDANQRFREIGFNILAQRAEGEVKPRVFHEDFPNLVIYAREVPVAGGGWQDVFLADLRSGPRSAMYLADQGRVVIDRENRRVDLVLEHGTQHVANAAGQYDSNTFIRQVLSVDATALFGEGGVPKGLNEMTVAELQAEIAAKEGTTDPATGLPYSTHNEQMAIHQKFSIPVACLVFGLIGLALGATHRRDGTLGSFVLGILVIFAYYVPLYLGPQLVKGGLLPPWLGKWLPNVILGTLGVMMFVWRDRVADQPIAFSLPAWLRRPRAQRHGGFLLERVRVFSILDRYVASAYLRVLLLCAVSLLGIFYITTFLDLSDKVFKGTASWTMLGDYFWHATPQWIYYVIPIAVLLAALVTIALLTKNSELIVMKACGISLYRVAMPMFGTALVAGAALFAMQETVLGAANRRAAELRHVIRGGSPDTFDVLNRRWVAGTDGAIYHYDWFDPRTRTLTGLSVFEFADGMDRLTRRTYVEQAAWVPADEGDPLDVWRLQQGWTREFDETGEMVHYAPFEVETRPLETASYFGTEQPNPEFMGYAQLASYIDVLRSRGLDVLEHQVALGRKAAFPFITLVMTLIAVPFAVSIGRSGAMGGIGAGIGLAITYWGVISIFAALGTGGVLTPLLAAWAPNLLFGAGAAYLLLTVRT